MCTGRAAPHLFSIHPLLLNYHNHVSGLTSTFFWNFFCSCTAYLQNAHWCVLKVFHPFKVLSEIRDFWVIPKRGSNEKINFTHYESSYQLSEMNVIKIIAWQLFLVQENHFFDIIGQNIVKTYHDTKVLETCHHMSGLLQHPHWDERTKWLILNSSRV